MQKIILFALLPAISLYFSSCKTNSSDELSHHHHAHEHGHEHSHEHKSENSDEITLSPDMAERFGVTTETVTLAPFYDALKVSGEIQPSPTEAAVLVAPTSGIISFKSGISIGSRVSNGTVVANISSKGISGGDRNLAARAAYEAAKRELDRLKPLFEERLITAAEYNAAVKTYEEAKAGYSVTASSGSIVSPISGVITSIGINEGQYVETGTQIAAVSSSSHLTLRADVPQRYYNRIAKFSDALVKLPYSETAITLSDIGGKRITSGDAATSVSPGYIPVYFSFNNNGSFIPGMSVDIYLRSDETTDIISVPLTALSEQQGLFYVFVRLDDDCYRKTLVTTGRNNGERIEIKSGLQPGEDVVVEGTTTVRIAESSGAVPEGHSHNH